MNKRKVSELARALAYQTAAGIHTYGVCSMPGCNQVARGSAHCDHCVEKELTKEIGAVSAGKLHRLYLKRSAIQSDIDEMLGEL